MIVRVALGAPGCGGAGTSKLRQSKRGMLAGARNRPSWTATTWSCEIELPRATSVQSAPSGSHARGPRMAEPSSLSAAAGSFELAAPAPGVREVSSRSILAQAVRERTNIRNPAACHDIATGSVGTGRAAGSLNSAGDPAPGLASFSPSKRPAAANCESMLAASERMTQELACTPRWPLGGRALPVNRSAISAAVASGRPSGEAPPGPDEQPAAVSSSPEARQQSATRTAAERQAGTNAGTWATWGLYWTMNRESLTGNRRLWSVSWNFAQAGSVKECIRVPTSKSGFSTLGRLGVVLAVAGTVSAAAGAAEPAPQVEKSPVALAITVAATGETKANTPTASVGIHVPAPAASHEPAQRTTPAPQPGTVGKAISVPRSASFADRVRTVSAIGPAQSETDRTEGTSAARTATSRTISPLRSFDGSMTFGYTYLNPPGQRPYFIGVSGPFYGDLNAGANTPRTGDSNTTNNGNSVGRGTAPAAPANRPATPAPAPRPAGRR